MATFAIPNTDSCRALLLPGPDRPSDRLLLQWSDRLIVVDPSTLAVLTEFGVRGQVADVTVSPAATQIAWSEIDPTTGGRQVSWASLVGGESTTVYAHPNSGDVSQEWLDDDVGFGWIGDGTLLAWPWLRIDEIPLTRIDLASGTSEVLATVPGRNAFVWLLGGGRIALVEYSNNDGSTPWLAIPTSGGAPRELPELAGMQFSALPERDSTFAFLSPYNLSNASGRSYLLLDTGTLAVDELISADGGRDHGIPVFSPDGRHALISRWWAEPTTVWCDLGSRGTVVIDGSVPAYYSPDGRHVSTWEVGATHEDRRGLQLRTLDGVIVREFQPASWLAWVA